MFFPRFWKYYLMRFQCGSIEVRLDKRPFSARTNELLRAVTHVFHLYHFQFHFPVYLSFLQKFSPKGLTISHWVSDFLRKSAPPDIPWCKRRKLVQPGVGFLKRNICLWIAERRVLVHTLPVNVVPCGTCTLLHLEPIYTWRRFCLDEVPTNSRRRNFLRRLSFSWPRLRRQRIFNLI